MLNKVILIGRLGRDPETRFMAKAKLSVTFP
nr:MAG TPA: single stranded DNA-binding protein (ssb) [Caudoviricetes sp.]